MISKNTESTRWRESFRACLPMVGCLLIGLWPVCVSSARVLHGLAYTLDKRFGTAHGSSYNALLVALPAIDAALFLAAVRQWEKASWAEIGLKTPRAGELLMTIGATLICLRLIVALMFGRGYVPLSALGARTSASRLAILVLLLAGGAVYEELVFRGYVISRVERLSSSAFIGACASLGISVAAHIPHWGISSAFRKIPLNLFLVALYLLRGNVTLCCAAHFTADLTVELFYGGARAFLQGS